MSSKFIVAALLAAGTAHAGSFISGANLARALASKTKDSIGYVVGVHDAYDGRLFCTPEDAQVDQVVSAVAGHLASLRDLERPAERLVMDALQRRWPCKGSPL